MLTVSPCHKCLGTELGITSRADNLLAELSNRIIYKVKCQRCSFCSTGKSIEQAIAKWNQLFNEHESNEVH